MSPMNPSSNLRLSPSTKDLVLEAMPQLLLSATSPFLNYSFSAESSLFSAVICFLLIAASPPFWCCPVSSVSVPPPFVSSVPLPFGFASPSERDPVCTVTPDSESIAYSSFEPMAPPSDYPNNSRTPSLSAFSETNCPMNRTRSCSINTERVRVRVSE